MSVYTQLTKEELEVLLNLYDIGSYHNIEGINEGITNSNFYLTTSKDKYILTIFEEPNMNLNYAIDLMEILSKNQILCPIPIKTKKGETIISIKNKPLTIFSLIPGETLSNKIPSKEMCSQIGEILGKIHLISKDYKNYYEGLRGNKWFLQMSEKLKPFLNIEECTLIDKEIENQIYCTKKNLPKGIIHSDLFRDNAMFKNGLLTGVIDFYYACNGYFLYDLAIIVNDWCLNNDMSIDIEKQNVLIKSYSKNRKIEKIEIETWQNALRHAALRFWLSRLHDKHFPTTGEMTHLLDPNVFKLILLDRIEKSYKLKI